MNALADRIRKLREERGLKQKEVAAELKVNPNTYCRYEKGERTPPPDIIKKLAEFFNVTTDYLLGRSNEEHSVPDDISAIQNVYPANDRFIRIPIYGVIRAGNPIYAEENIIDYFWIAEKDVRGGNYFLHT